MSQDRNVPGCAPAPVLRVVPYAPPFPPSASPHGLKRMRLDSTAHAEPAVLERYSALPCEPAFEGVFTLDKPDPDGMHRTPNVLAAAPSAEQTSDLRERRDPHPLLALDGLASGSCLSPGSGSSQRPPPPPLPPVAAASAASLQDAAPPMPPTVHTAPSSLVVPSPSKSPPMRLLTAELAASDPALQPLLSQQERARNLLQAESHRVRADTAARAHADTATAAKYKAHVASYEKWWGAYQVDLLAQEMIEEPIPAHPITAAKATLFLDHEMTREKRKAGSKETIPGSSLGKSHIAGVVSALEARRRSDAHLYEGMDPDSQMQLRMDERIRTMEKSSRHREPLRADTANTLKATGTSSDAYTPEDLVRCTDYCLAQTSTRKQMQQMLRDRAMLLLSAGTAFRGDSARMVQWSDLFLSAIHVNEFRMDVTIPVLGVYSDNAKHNQQGRVDESGVLRHRIVELCPVGAVALLFWAHFHVQSAPVPQFAPDFSDPTFGEFGRRDWYPYHLFWASDIKLPMSYDNHYDRIKKIHLDNHIALSKVTHAPRHYGAQNTRNHGASVSGTKAMGGWSDSGSFRPCYDRAFPVDALIAAAMFNGREPSSYFLARDQLAPPQDLLQSVFPWIEDEQRALTARAAASRIGVDIALQHFLRLLLWFRTVLLQDAAVLFSRQPHLPIFKHHPFHLDRFKEYARGATDIIAEAEMEAQCALENLPERIVQSVRGLLTESSMDRKREAATTKAAHQDLVQRFDMLQAAFEMSNGSRRSSRKRKLDAVDAEPTLTAATSAAPVPTPSLMAGGAFAGAMPAPPAPPYTLVPSAVHAAPFPLPAPALFSAPATAAMPPGALQMPTAAAPWLPSNPLATHGPDPRMKKRDAMRVKYGDECIARHPWELIGSELTPSYLMQNCKTISDIWMEYTVGLNGFLPVRELEENWGPKWRGNIPKVKTAWGRRKKVIDLVIELSKKPRWDVDLALRFLRDVYGGSHTAGTFCVFLQKTDARGHETVMERSNSYP